MTILNLKSQGGSRMVRFLLASVLCIAWASAQEPELLNVPDVRQSTSYTCGASALQAVLAYWGQEIREDRLAEKLGSDPSKGTSPQAIVNCAREAGLEAKLREGLSLADLEKLVGQGIPVIVAGQAWREEGVEGDWNDEWECGHYMIVIGLDQQFVYFEDPSLLGSRGTISRPEFEQRWHDVDGAGRRYNGLGIVISGPTPNPPPGFAPVR